MPRPIITRLGLSAPKVPIEQPGPMARRGGRRGASAVAAPRQPAPTVAAVPAPPMQGSWRPVELTAL